MNIVKPIIFTRGRLDNQITLNSLPSWLQKETVLLVYPEEFYAHKEKYGHLCHVVKTPPEVKGIASRREWAIKSGNTALIQWQMDDDLTFCKAKTETLDGSWPFVKFEAIEESDWTVLLKDIEAACRLGFHAGGLGQRISPCGIADYPASVNSRVYTNTWFDLRSINPRDYDWTGKEWESNELVPEDFHIQCQLVESGIPILNMNKWGTGGNKTQASGGCAEIRNLENHNKGMERFAEIWKKCATLRWKDSWEKGKQKAALTIRLNKLYPYGKSLLEDMEAEMRTKLGARPKPYMKQLEKEASIKRKEAQENAA
jgi:hypothetical protein